MHGRRRNGSFKKLSGGSTCNHLDFDTGTPGQSRDLNGRTGRVGSREEFRVHLVHALKFREIGHEDGRLDDMREVEVLILQDQPYVLENPTSLVPDVPKHRSTGLRGVDGDLSRTKEQVTDSNAVGIGSQCGSRRRRTDRNLRHGKGYCFSSNQAIWMFSRIFSFDASGESLKSSSSQTIL